MKQLYTLFLLLLAGTLTAQTPVVDTIFFEDFQDDLSEVWETVPIGDDTVYVNFDADGLVPNGGDEAEYQWFQVIDFGVPTDDTSSNPNVVLGSKSWMEGFAPGNRNWFILPPITITDENYTLSWKSAPYQLPRYMDGYTVLVSTTHNRAYDDPNPFTDTLFHHAQMTEITGEGQSVDINNFAFSEGYIHADTITDWTYLFVSSVNGADTTLLGGYLEPHSASLADYAGQTIYIAFLHDSDDDNLISIDDVLITRSEVSGTNEAALDLRLRAYPNPVDDQLNLVFQLDAPAEVEVRVTDALGRTVRLQRSGRQPAGEHLVNLPLAELSAGQYFVTLRAGEAVVSRGFTKR